MRTIKFRAWYKKKKVLGEVTEIHFSEPFSIVLYKDFGKDGCGYGKVKEKQIELMQYTGLKDKNGKEIYEGDVVLWANRNFVVEWEKDHFIMKTQEEGFGSVDWWEECEVIGNIYENKELLEGMNDTM